MKKDSAVWNTRTGARATVRAVWLNEVTGQKVVNVREDGQRSGFVMWHAEIVSTEPVIVTEKAA